MAKVRVRDKTEQWRDGFSAINKTIDMMHDDLIDKGWDDENAINSVLAQERTEMLEELARNIDGDFSTPYQQKEFADLNDISYPDEIISPEERAEESTDELLVDSSSFDISADQLSTGEIMDVYIPEETSDEIVDSYTEESDSKANRIINDADYNNVNEEQASDLTEIADEPSTEESAEQEEQCSDLSGEESTGESTSEGEGSEEEQSYSY